MTREDPRRGAALFIVLVFAALLAGLAATATRTAVSGARAAAVFADGLRADELGRAAADVVLFQLAKADLSGRRAGALRVRLTDAEIDVSYASESARVDANMAPLELVAALLAAAGAEPPVVADIVARIARLRQTSAKSGAGDHAPGQGSEAPAAFANGTGARVGPTGGAASRPDDASAAPQIEEVLDVVRAWGLPVGLARRVLPALTVASRAKTVDPILADRLVLTALLGGDEARVDDYMERRSQGFASAASALALHPVPLRPFVGFVDARPVRAVARVTVAKRLERRYEFVVSPPDGAGQAGAILSWRPLY